MKPVILAVSLFLPLFFSVASAQPTKMTVGYGSTSTNHFPAWMAKESGIFRVNGLDVQLVYFRGGTTAMMALLSRETPISEIAGPSVVSASLRGTDVVLIAGGVVTSDQSLVSRPDIKTAEQLKGGSIGTSFGGLADSMTRIARTDSGEGCRIPADRRLPGDTECLGEGKGSGHYAPHTRQLHSAEKGLL